MACWKRCACPLVNACGDGTVKRSASATYAQMHAGGRYQLVRAQRTFSYLDDISNLDITAAVRLGLRPDLTVLERDNALPAATGIDMDHAAFDTARHGGFEGLLGLL